MLAGNGGTYCAAAVFGSVFIERKGADEAGIAGQLIRRFDWRLGSETVFKKLDDDFRFTAAGFDAIAGQRLFETLGKMRDGNVEVFDDLAAASRSLINSGVA